MSSVADNRTRRRHDAEASRQDLLAAALELFDERGYDATTLRDIGERAGVDPALIARYFGGKEGLYLAALGTGAPRDVPVEPRALLQALLCHPEHKRNTPVSRALVSPALTDAVRDQVRTILQTRALGALTRELEGHDVPDARLRAELLLALMIGVSLTRSNGTLEAVASTDAERLVEVLVPVVEQLGGYATGSSASRGR
jgi:AcrR family transcriptional regulator